MSLQSLDYNIVSNVPISNYQISQLEATYNDIYRVADDEET